MRNLGKIIIAMSTLFAFACTECKMGAHEQAALPEDCITLANEKISVTIGKDGKLYSLKNEVTKQEYASTSGDYLWRIYYDTHTEEEIQVLGEGQNVEVSQEGNSIILNYPSVKAHGKEIKFALTLKVILEEDKVRFAADIANNEPHTIIRELQYPLIRDIQAPADHKLFTAHAGGKLHDNPIKTISDISPKHYFRPEQYFYEHYIRYGYLVFMNCFALLGEEQGLYFGSHDKTFQDTTHGLRVYKRDNGKFDILELGFYKYPHCMCGSSWSNDSNVVSPYAGTWHNAADMYRAWANEWFDYKPAPEWVQKMRSWQRVIFKHQYGEYFFKYPDLYGRLKDVDKSINSNTVFLFGWWAEGMDNGNPDYSPDYSQGGDAALKEAISKYQADGSHLLLYYNGKLIDRDSRYYKSGMGEKVCRHDITGAPMLERYKFTGHGSYLNVYGGQTFAVATMMNPEWNKELAKMQDRAYQLGASSVFYDQLGFIERESANWDASGEFPIPDVFAIQKRMQVLEILRERYIDKAPEFALGTESTVDALAQYAAYTHGHPSNKDSKSRWMRFFRYTFPEFIFSERGHRDDRDVQWHVNYTILDGQRIDIEIYRCRDLIDKCPIYQAYLNEVNIIKEKYEDMLLCGRYMDTKGIDCSNKEVEARAYLSNDGQKMAVVVANQLREAQTLKTKLEVPGFRYVEHSTLGNAKVTNGGKRLTLGQYDLAVLLFEKE